MKTGGKILLFFSSYFPLWVVIFIVQLPQLLKSKITFFAGLGLLLSIFTLWTIYQFERTYGGDIKRLEKNIKIAKISHGSSEIVSYIITIMVPFFTPDVLKSIMNNTMSVEIIISALYFVFLLFIYVNSNLVTINPLLILLGYKIYKIEYKYEGEDSSPFVEGVLILKNYPDNDFPPSVLSAQSIDDCVFLFRLI